jgi:type IV conjugative transfer system protein TraL
MNYRIPKTLDNPMRAAGIPVDTLLVFTGIWSGFVLFDQGFWGIFAGLASAGIFGRFRTRSVIRRIVRFIYWHLPAEMNFIKGVQGHQRRLNMRFKSDGDNE